ncbi:acyltransferase family protein [Butyrivibrio sp. AE3006]|uniref:acyltransferase family protein n=1 Tax=Butyrivibrio sp. AE3006 TaxID=1280673 RepID=UPI00040A44B7|nr:acyltransferase family protein [Butyrivibrio sp. AE3006]
MKKEEYTIKNSLGMFDLLKGTMMILVMVGHTYQLVPIIEEYNYSVKDVLGQVNLITLIFYFWFKVIAEASMPAFFILSGYGFRKTTNKKCILKQFKTLMIPYSISVMITVIVHFCYIQLMYSSVEFSIRRTISIILGGLFGLSKEVYINDLWIQSCGPIWFLLSLMIATIIFNVLSNCFQDKRLLVASFLVSCVGWGMSFAGTLPWGISQGLIAVLYVWLGHYVKKNKILISTIKVNGVTVSLFLGLVLYLLFVSADSVFVMAYNIYPLGIVSIIANGFIGLIVIRLFLQMDRFKGPFLLFIRRIGRLSLYVLCIHSIELIACGGMIHYAFATEWWKGGIFLRNLIIIGVRVTVVLAVTFAFERIRLAIKKKRFR